MNAKEYFDKEMAPYLAVRSPLFLYRKAIISALEEYVQLSKQRTGVYHDVEEFYKDNQICSGCDQKHPTVDRDIQNETLKGYYEPSVINNVFTTVNHREGEYNLHDFDHLKTIFRSLGQASTDVTLLCGRKQFEVFKDILRDFRLKREELSSPAYPLLRVFKKNGDTFWIQRVKGMGPWATVIIPKRLDIL